MEHFVVYTNVHKDKNLTVTYRIRDYLVKHGKLCSIRTTKSDWKKRGSEGSRLQIDTNGKQIHSTELNIPADADCMIVLGGDGTMLQAAAEIRKYHLPLIGVNLGTLGYMTEIETESLEESLDLLMEDKYSIESRMMLKGKVTCSGKTEEDWALNDVVISRSGSLQIINFNILVNGQFLNHYSADGVIITTPTGSTGYNLSAGGPIVEPNARLIVVTLICPHTLNQRSVILSPEDVIEIEIPEGREGMDQYMEVSFDGNQIIPVKTGDRIRINQSEKTTEILSLNKVSFLELLHKKMSE